MEDKISFTKKEIDEEIHDLFQKTIYDFLYGAPVWMRLNYILHTLSRCFEKTGSTEADVDWKKVNTILSQNIDQYDFNIFDEVCSVEDLLDIRERLQTANLIDGLPWRRCKCKDCGKLFYLSWGEVNFYQRKKLDTPKRCPDCRKARKNKIAKNIQ